MRGKKSPNLAHEKHTFFLARFGMIYTCISDHPPRERFFGARFGMFFSVREYSVPLEIHPSSTTLVYHVGHNLRGLKMIGPAYDVSRAEDQ